MLQFLALCSKGCARALALFPNTFSLSPAITEVLQLSVIKLQKKVFSHFLREEKVIYEYSMLCKKILIIKRGVMVNMQVLGYTNFLRIFLYIVVVWYEMYVVSGFPEALENLQPMLGEPY